MKRFFEMGNRYVERSDWRDLALVKFCLFAMGVIVGTQVPRKQKKAAAGIASLVFIATYIPLMTKLFGIMKEMFGTKE